MRTWLCVGDSITFGLGESPALGWVGRLKRQVEKSSLQRVFNLGVSGDTSADVLDRFEAEVQARIKRLDAQGHVTIVLAVGINDSKSIGDQVLVSLHDFRDNFRLLISQARSLADQVVVLSCTCVDEEVTSQFDDVSFSNSKIQQYNQVIFEEFPQAINVFDVLSSEDFSDGLHPNSAGYDMLFDHIKKLI